jgi:hypothetical protein
VITGTGLFAVVVTDVELVGVVVVEVFIFVALEAPGPPGELSWLHPANATTIPNKAAAEASFMSIPP